MSPMIEKTPDWKVVDGSKGIRKQCPRCHNEVVFRLVYDTEGFFLIKKIILKTRTLYALHCPICIYAEEVSKSTRKDLMGG